MLSRKSMTAVLVGVMCLAAAGAVWAYSASHQPGDGGLVLLIIDGASGNLYHKDVDVAESDAFVLGVLQAASVKDRFDLQTKTSTYGVMVTSVFGQTATSTCYWWYYLNGADGQVGADQQPVKGGDVVRWEWKCS